jgi:hypothetical protein
MRRPYTRIDMLIMIARPFLVAVVHTEKDEAETFSSHKTKGKEARVEGKSGVWGIHRKSWGRGQLSIASRGRRANEELDKRKCVAKQ